LAQILVSELQFQRGALPLNNDAKLRRKFHNAGTHYLINRHKALIVSSITTVRAVSVARVRFSNVPDGIWTPRSDARRRERTSSARARLASEFSDSPFLPELFNIVVWKLVKISRQFLLGIPKENTGRATR
jgi:hypothetical protein